MHLGVLLLAAALGAEALPAGEMPHVLDARLAIELFAADPDIVTPTGIAVDAEGRVLAVESHTHFPLDDYPGLQDDRIRMFEDTDGDGRADRITTFFEGTKWTMNVGVHPDGSVYVATRRRDFSPARHRRRRAGPTSGTPIVRLETAGDYPHNGLSGFAFDFAGNVVFRLWREPGGPVQADRRRRLDGQSNWKGARSTAAGPTARAADGGLRAFGTRFTWPSTRLDGCLPSTTIPIRCRLAD